MRVEKLHQEHLNGVVALLERYQPKTRYQFPPVDKDTVRGICLGSIHAKQHVGYVVTDGLVVGVLLGRLEPYPWNDRYFFGTDVLLVAEKGGAWLVRRFLRWCQKPRVLDVKLAESAGVETASLMYEAMGFRRIGSMWEMPMKASRRKAA